MVAKGTQNVHNANTFHLLQTGIYISIQEDKTFRNTVNCFSSPLTQPVHKSHR